MATTETTTSYIGISNENEFYSQHYLSEIFKGDIKAILDAWQTAETEREGETKAPFNRLKTLHKDYFVIRDRLVRAQGAKRRIELQREFFQALLTTLGYNWQPQDLVIEGDVEIPVLAQVAEPGKPPTLIALGAYDPAQEQIDPLSLSPLQEQFHAERPADPDVLKETWNEIITRRIFAQTAPPRWVLLLSDAQLLLIDRSKWNQNRLLRFDWLEILGRREDHTLRATTALLHADSLTPGEGISLLDTLDENSHKHAFAVSEDLKYAIRAAIELLGNEAADYLIEHTKIGYTGKQALDADQLTRECLRYMYRLLFMFYIEARPDLGYVPLDSPAYRAGYSLESLRDLELVRLTGEQSRHGYYFHTSIEMLFKIIHEGYSGVRAQTGLELEQAGIHNSFHIEGLDSHLFDPQYTKLLNKVRFRNETLQRIIQLMSLTRPAKGRKRRGRISYAQLGINQLGAVYEALLSYRGFFADKDLYEVKKAGTNPDELETGYFVSADDLEAYTEDERVYDKDEQGHKKLRMFPKGTFIYRLAGRDRQKSASYYTPEVLTKTLVKYALKELLKDKTADEILTLTVCEPAMGSAAFLNEAVNQLAEAYLERKQAELDTRIPHEDYAQVLQQTRMVIADHNVFGVDLNPVSVELAEVSLWLNCIHGGSQVPWFGYQLFAGNSLIGSRRQVYGSERLKQNAAGDRWYENAPVRLEPTDPRREPHQVYHFLLPDPGMANYTDRVAKSLAPDEFQKMKDWRREFTKPFDNDDIDTLQRYSAKVDELWAEHTRQLAQDRTKTEDELPVWGQPESSAPNYTTTREKDRIRSEGIFNLNAKTASAYRRLKMVMDYWCALWFWPIDQADLLPDRDTFLMEIGLLLTGNVLDTSVEQGEMDFETSEALEVAEARATYARQTQHGQEEMPFPGTQNALALDNSQEEAARVTDSKGQLQIERLFKHFPRLRLVHELAERNRFFHWELAFADVFSTKGGFDLIVGNPPWIKVEWQESGVLGDYHPLFNLQDFSATKLREEREASFERYPELKRDWFSEYEQADATQSFLNGMQNYPLLKGVQTNLYKCFLPQAWMVGNYGGVSGFLHPEGIYDDPKGGRLRAEIYPRLKAHFQFQNEFQLFVGTNDHGRMRFGLHIYTNRKAVNVAFSHISNLYAPATVDFCFQHDGNGPVPGIKNDKNKWNTTGHAHRIIVVDETALATFAKLYDEPGTSRIQARLPALHAQELLSVLEKFAKQPRRLGDLKENYFPLEMWHETNAQNDGTIRRETRFPDSAGEWVLSGPHFFVGTPFYKTPRATCTQNSHYEALDLTELPNDYLPRTNYVPACSVKEYRSRVPVVPWVVEVKERKLITNYYRLIHRRQLNQSGERTLISAIIPKDCASINTCISTCFDDNEILLDAAGVMASIVIDYFIKSTGKGDLYGNGINVFPYLCDDAIRIRVLILNCVSELYSSLWEDCWNDRYSREVWAKDDPRLLNAHFSALSNTWHRNSPVRSYYQRRQALLEVDVLMAMHLGLNLNELKTIYKVQFPVMHQYEADTWYDASGRIVFTASKGLTGVGLPRKASRKDTPCLIRYPDGREEEKSVGWEDVRDLPDGAEILQTLEDDTLPAGPRQKTITYVAPFDRCDREEDYRTAWAVFEERFKNDANKD